MVETRTITAADWDMVAGVLGPDGCGGCWCVNHRIAPGMCAPTGAAARADLKELIEQGAARGVVALLEGRPVGWCAVDPRAAIPGHDCTPASDTAAPATWSIHCLFVRPEARGRGVARELVTAAVALAVAHGASRIEAYPADRGKGLDFTGDVGLYRSLGFDVSIRAVGPFWLAIRMPS